MFPQHLLYWREESPMTMVSARDFFQCMLVASFCSLGCSVRWPGVWPGLPSKVDGRVWHGMARVQTGRLHANPYSILLICMRVHHIKSQTTRIWSLYFPCLIVLMPGLVECFAKQLGPWHSTSAMLPSSWHKGDKGTYFHMFSTKDGTWNWKDVLARLVRQIIGCCGLFVSSNRVTFDILLLQNYIPSKVVHHITPQEYSQAQVRYWNLISCVSTTGAWALDCIQGMMLRPKWMGSILI